MKVNIDNYDWPSFELYDINLVQKEVGGGIISKEQIDCIRNFPNAESIIISGLKQDSFDYFVSNYGNQFRAISFWKNKLVNDLSALSVLNRIEFINYFFNQRATTLWNMSNNIKLKCLTISDFSRLHNIDIIKTAKNLECFCLFDRVYATSTIESLKPLTETNIARFTLGIKKVLDNDYKCLANSKIVELNISPCIFTMDELAELLSYYPDDLKGSITRPYVDGGAVEDKDGRKEYWFLCKGKKSCIKGKDDIRFHKYLKEFDELLAKYRKK